MPVCLLGNDCLAYYRSSLVLLIFHNDIYIRISLMDRLGQRLISDYLHGKMCRIRSKSSSGFFFPHEYFFADLTSFCKAKMPPTSFTKFAVSVWLWPGIKFPPLIVSPQPHLHLPIYPPFVETIKSIFGVEHTQKLSWTNPSLRLAPL